MAETKTGRRLIFQDGTTIEDAHCGYSDGNVWCWFPNYTMQAAAAILFDPQKTGVIVFEYGNMTDRYEDFTVCTTIFIDGDGTVSGCLKKGEG